MVADIHLHSSRMILFPIRILYKFKHRKTLLPAFSLKDMKKIGLDFAFVNGVGDPALLKFYSFKSNYIGLKNQIKKLVKEICNSNCILYDNFNSISQGIQEKKPVCLLAIEGADFLENKIERLQEIYDMGVRGLCLVHFSDNCIGKINTDVLSMVISSKIKEIEKKQGGLTEFGLDVIREMNRLSMVIDLAHGSSETLFDAVKISNKPILVSHTGVRAIQDFSRYLTDNEIKAVIEKDGLIGLWPFYFKGKGMKDLQAFVEHAKYLKNLTSSRNIAIGTDANGLPDAMMGYRFEKDIHNIGNYLIESGFNKEEVANIMGNNITQFLKKIESQTIK